MVKLKKCMVIGVVCLLQMSCMFANDAKIDDQADRVLLEDSSRFSEDFAPVTQQGAF